MTTTGQALILDMHSLAWRAYHTPVYRRLSTSQGDASGMFYGVLVQVAKLLKRFPGAVRVLCAYDGGYSGRHELYPQYKSNHNQDGESPDRKAFRLQLTLVMEFFDAMGFHRLLEYGIEADDLIAIYSKVWLDTHRKNTVVLVSIDSDFYQLLSLSARIGFYSHKSGQFYDAKNIQEKLVVPLEQYCVWKALVGDPSDAIPRCLGAKAALQFLQEPNIEKRMTPEMRRNLELIRLPYAYMPALRKQTNLQIVDQNIQAAEHVLATMEVQAFTVGDFTLRL